MHHRIDPHPALRRLAAAQEGYLSASQAARLGLPPNALSRLVAQGHWLRPAAHLYDLRPGEVSFDRQLWAAVLLAGDPCAIGGWGALHLQGLRTESSEVVIWVPPERRPRTRPEATVRRDGLGRLARSRGLPPRISADDALADLCAELPAEAIVALLTDAVRLRLTSPERVQRHLGERGRLGQRKLIREVLGDLTGVESTLEWAYRRDVERAHGLPAARRQLSLSVGSRSDAAYEQYGVIIELDGRRGHESASSVFRDLERDNRHAGAGLITLRYGSVDVRGHPCAVARQVWETLVARGFSEPFRSCARCQRSRRAG